MLVIISEPGQTMSNVDSLADQARDAKRAFGETVTDVRAKGEELAGHAQDAFTALRGALDDSIRTRPYTTLMMAAAAGFMYAVLRRR